MQGGNRTLIDIIVIIEWLLIIFVGLPLLVVMIIPMLVYFGEKSKRVPSFSFLLMYFKVDITKPPYCDWMERSPFLFIGLTSIELYISYFLIKLIRGIKWVVVNIAKLISRYMHWQWARWDEDFKKQEQAGGQNL